MRIISDHRDYYDCVQAQGVDLTCTWVRQLERVELPEWEFPEPRGWWRRLSGENVSIGLRVIGFCGSIYPLFGVYLRHCDKSVFCYSLDEIEQFMKKHSKPADFNNYINGQDRNRWRTNIGINRKEIIKLIAEFDAEKLSYSRYFTDNLCPAFVATHWCGSRARKSSIVYHGRIEGEYLRRDKARILPPTANMLKDYEFYRIFDTQSAFQEIHQYISGVLGVGNPHVPVPDDVTMRDIKGFDDKSFKKEPGKKRGRKKC